MTEIASCATNGPAAWTGKSLGGKPVLVRDTGPDFIAALDALAPRLRGRAFSEIVQHDFDHPAIASVMAEVRHDVMEGRGLAIVRGPDPARYDMEDYARLFWGLGTHLGHGAVQSQFGDYVARVERNPNLPWRGTTTDMELKPHTDFHEIMALASVSLPESGGVSGFVSSAAVHNEIARLHPDLLKPLYEGWFHVEPHGGRASGRKVPVYCVTQDKLSCFFNRVFFQKPQDASEPMPPELPQALALMDEIAARPDMAAAFVLEPGEIVFWHNFTVMHARTAFQDSEARRRLLLRLWLHAKAGHPMAAEIRERGRIMDRVHRDMARARTA